MRGRAAIGWMLVIGLLAAHAAAAQSAATFMARLDWVPISGAERTLVGGTGAASATLSRSRLAVTGCFAGLPAPATRASLHEGVATGARGPAIATLELTGGADGTFSGNIELTGAQRASLLAGHLYIQLHAERGVEPDNAVLWGWLLGGRSAALDCPAAR